jgi:hypothetical protein
MGITRRDVQHLKEAEDFLQKASKMVEELRWRPGTTEGTRKRATEAHEAVVEAYSKARTLRGRIEADEDVAL